MTRLLAGAAALAVVTSAGQAAAAEEPLILEIVLNGRSTGRVAEFLKRGDTLFVGPADLRDVGLIVPDPATGPLIALPAIAGVRTQLDEARQVLLIVAADSALRPRDIRGGSVRPALAPLTASEIGIVVNYDLLGTVAGGNATGGALLDTRVFGRHGVVQATSLVSVTPYERRTRFVRLDTTYTFSDPAQMRRYRIGDVISGALQSSRPVRLGGVQINSDFDLRPDFITYPLPVISATAAVPSTVEVLVNGVRQYDEAVQPGPFRVHAPPMVTGAGEVAVATRDAVGRQTMVTLPFYASSALLRSGLTGYSLEFGAVRRDYALAGDHYDGWAANGSIRHGVSDQMTLEAHGEATNDLVLAGAGATWKVGTIGLLNAAVSASGGAAGGGPQAAIGFERRSRTFNVSVAGSWASRGYRDIAATSGYPVPRRTLSASIGRNLGPWGTLGLAYVSQNVAWEGWRRPAGSISLPRPMRQTDLVTFGYNVPVARRLAFRASGFKNLGDDGNYSVGIGLNILLGRNTSASAAVSLDGGGGGGHVGLARPALEQGELGYQLHENRGEITHRTATAEYLGSWGRVTAGFDQSPAGVAVRAGLRGAVVWTGGELFPADQIRDSFAIVRTGGVAGVPVLYENRLLGRTGPGGMLLVPSLRSYQDNRLAVDATGLPADVEVGQTATMVRPYDRAGILVDFDIKPVSAALLKLRNRQGVAIPVGSIARIAGAEDRPVGHDGETYLTGLMPFNHLVVSLPDGTSCSASFAYRRVIGDIPLIGPVVCQ